MALRLLWGSVLRPANPGHLEARCSPIWLPGQATQARVTCHPPELPPRGDSALQPEPMQRQATYGSPGAGIIAVLAPCASAAIAVHDAALRSRLVRCAHRRALWMARRPPDGFTNRFWEGR